MSKSAFDKSIAALKRIAAEFPEAFQRPIRPLSLDSRQRLREAGYTVLETKALGLYCVRADYLKALTKGTRRVPLDGSDSDLPSEEAITHAKERLTALKARRKTAKAAEKANELKVDTTGRPKAKPIRPKANITPKQAPMETAMRAAFRKLDRPTLTLRKS